MIQKKFFADTYTHRTFQNFSLALNERRIIFFGEDKEMINSDDIFLTENLIIDSENKTVVCAKEAKEKVIAILNKKIAKSKAFKMQTQNDPKLGTKDKEEIEEKINFYIQNTLKLIGGLQMPSDSPARN